ncbi:NUDIX hydrolase [Pseudorhodoplanes sp.]|uniref:NUDIX hydrolase n=1 Tax=Pseudorhodoplanes sp. TaxID=1934341 RepID=UPI003D0D910F
MQEALRDVLRIESLDLSVGPFDWAFARERRADIDDHFEAARRDRPGLWNGRVLLMHQHEIEGSTLRGRYFETDFASFMAWRDFGFPGGEVTNCFALGALRGSDGVYVLGVMSAGTMNPGRIYFPGGTPDLSDVVGAEVDLEASVRREVCEETGLDIVALDIDAGWHCVPAGPMIALLKPMQSRETGAQLRERISANLARETEPELADAYLACATSDIHPMMPGFIEVFLRTVLRSAAD